MQNLKEFMDDDSNTVGVGNDLKPSSSVRGNVPSDRLDQMMPHLTSVLLIDDTPLLEPVLESY